MKPFRPPPLPPTVEPSATDCCCRALAPVFCAACRMPMPLMDEVMPTAPLVMDPPPVTRLRTFEMVPLFRLAASTE